MNKSSFAWFLSSKLASLFKLSFIVGSQTAFFSAINVANPLIGAFNTRRNTLLIFCALFISRWLISGAIDLHGLAFFVPGLFAALYWNVAGPAVRLLVPALCFCLFLAHPTGLAAAPYAFFWIIPIALYFKKGKPLFFHALSSTLIAHAVGSVIWIYSVPMSAAAWLALIPIVCLERFTFAAAITVTHSLIAYSMSQRHEAAPRSIAR
jgi:hypothetical protein